MGIVIMRFGFLAAAVASFVALLSAMPTQAQAPVHSAAFAAGWHDAAAADSEVALTLIEENHPGAAPQLSDKEFLSRLSLAERHVAERLPKVVDFGGYSALMDGLAADFRDGHIWSSAELGWKIVRWVGIVPIRKNGSWFVGAQKANGNEPDLSGAEIISCDGIAFDQFAKQRIGDFVGNPSLEAVLTSGASSLLLDFQNPFIMRPKSCIFRKAGTDRTLVFSWRRELLSRINTLATNAIHQASAGLGVRMFSGGYWIALDTLTDKAKTVVDAVRANQQALRTAPTVVVDLRGNGGGNSEYASEIAAALVGEASVRAVEAKLPLCGGSYWRASAQNLQAAEISLQDARREGNQETVDFLTPVVTEMTRAIAAGHAFSPDLPVCASKALTVDQDLAGSNVPRTKMEGRLILVTDHACFSSCLIAVNLFRKLGALHVGEPTDMSTRYMEVREEAMPSGLRTFSTLQKVVVGLGNYGPYRPQVPYTGDLADTKALQTWVAGLK